MTSSVELQLRQLKVGTDTQFIEDFNQSTNLNGAKSNIATWNLIVTRRDVKLYQVGMKPHRGWKITDVKNYFGIKGNKDVIVEKIEALCKIFIPKD